ncbi:MAG: T9SS type A sorting domain-containing protein, partial [Candidatus Kapaibacteriota bacterium]
SPNGKTVWAKAIGGVGNDRVNDVLADKECMVYIYATFNSNFLVFKDTIFNKGYSDIILAKYDPYNNNYLWQINISGEDKEYPASMTFGIGNKIYLSGEFQSSNLKFGNIDLTNSGSYDFYLAIIDTNGNILKVRSFGSYADEYAKKIVADKNGNIYIGGYFASPSLVLDNTTLLNSTNDNYSDIFTAKFDPELNAIYGKTAGGKGEDQSFSIAIDQSGNIFQTGYFNSREIFFNKKSIYNYGYSNVFLSKLNPDIPSKVERSCISDLELIVYPNPCENFINFEISSQSAPIKCEILNYLGKKITEILLYNTSVLETKELPKGLYFLRISGRVVPFQKL